RLQRSESKAQYLLKGFELLPEWKMVEIENQLHAPEIWVDAYPYYKQFQFAGGIAFTKPENVRECDNFYSLNAIIEDCTIRQTFGCDDRCADAVNSDGLSAFFVFPTGYQDGNYIYNDAGQPIATTMEEFVNWLINQPNVTNAELIATSP